MTVVAIYGNPKKGGFVHECVDHVGAHLRGKGEDVQELRLAEKNVLDCSGCFSCLKTGRCESDDDMNDIRSTLREAAGFVVGASVRNGFFPALYKKFYERICYPIGFTRDLRDKPVLAIGAVGLAGGKKMLKRVLTFQEFQAKTVKYLFFRTGIPTRRRVEDVAPKLTDGAEKFLRAPRSPSRRPWWARLAGGIDNFVMRKFMFERDTHGTYAHVIKVWKERGLM